MIVVTGIHCHKCDEYVYSRTLRDTRWCSCSSVGVYGGVNSFKYFTKKDADYQIISINLDKTISQLTRDFRRKYDMLGKIPNFSKEMHKYAYFIHSEKS